MPSPPQQVTVVTPPPVERETQEEAEEQIEETQEAIEDIDELSEQLAVHSIISEERHEEILGEVNGCREQLTTLQSQIIGPGQTDSPQLALILEQIGSVSRNLDEIRGDLQKLMARSRLSESTESRQSIPIVSVPSNPSGEENVQVRADLERTGPLESPKRRRSIL